MRLYGRGHKASSRCWPEEKGEGEIKGRGRRAEGRAGQGREGQGRERKGREG
jgi:hypothetical protein